MDTAMEEGKEDKLTLELPSFTSLPISFRVLGYGMLKCKSNSIFGSQVLVSSILIHFKPSWKLADPLCTLIFGIFALVSTLPTIW